MHNKSILANSIRVVSEKIEHTRIVSLGVWVDVGSRDENEQNNGSSHFVEHMLFKGTVSRSAQQIARELDVLGGMSNGYTANENTCFYATFLDQHLPEVIELFADVFQDSLFAEEEVEREQQVILQEISMVDDTPDDLIHDLFNSRLWGGHPLGNTVLGVREVVGAMTSRTLLDFKNTFYTPDKIVIAAAGNVDHERFVRLCEQCFFVPACGPERKSERQLPVEQPVSRRLFPKTVEQVHMILGCYGLSITAAERYNLHMLNIILGGNMSSRLFQEIREKRGLAYSIYSFLSSNTDSGLLGIYLGVEPRSVNEAVSLIRLEIERLASNSISAEELANAKDYAIGGMFLAAENMEARMTRIARNELCFGRNISLDEVAASISQVTGPDIAKLAARLFARPLSGVALGPLTEDEINWDA